MNASTAREHAIRILHAAIHAVQPANLLPQYLSVREEVVFVGGESISHPAGKIYVIGAGKAAAAMAAVTEQLLGNRIHAGIVTTKYGHALPTQKVRVMEAAHPVPDEQGVEAVKATRQLLQEVTPQDTVICLISGGASALWCDVPAETSLQEVQTVFDRLIRSGASIAEINTVRKHLSAIKGGQLVRHCNGAHIYSLVISDVPGDDLSVIASGPTVADSTTYKDATEVLHRYQLWHNLPHSIKRSMEEGLAGKRPETPKPGDPIFFNTHNFIIGSNKIALNAATAAAKALEYEVQLNPSFITGSAEEAATTLVHTAMSYDGPLPACIIQGGETTVKVTGRGIGGRNQHFVLSALQVMNSSSQSATRLTILSGGTDGTDGPTGATGAIGDQHTLRRAAEVQLDITSYLKDHDAWHFFQRTDSLVVTGPTQTNVMDVMIALIEKNKEG